MTKNWIRSLVSALSYMGLTYTSDKPELNNLKAKNAVISSYLYYNAAFSYLH